MNSKSLHADSLSSSFGRKRQAGKTDESLVTRLRSLSFRSPSSTDDPPSDAAIDDETDSTISSTSSPEEEFEALYSDASFVLEANQLPISKKSTATELVTSTAEIQDHTAFAVLPSDKCNSGKSNKRDDDDDYDIDDDCKGKYELQESSELACLTQLILFKSNSTSKEEARISSSPPLRLLNRKGDAVKVTYKGRLIAFLSHNTITNNLSCNKGKISNKNRLGWTARVQSRLSKFRWAFMQKANEEIIEDCTNNGTKDDSRTSGISGDGKTCGEDEKTEYAGEVNVKVKGKKTRGVDAQTGVNAMSSPIYVDDATEKQSTLQDSACQRNKEGDIDSHPDDEVAVLPISDVVENDGHYSAKFSEDCEDVVYKNTECVDDCSYSLDDCKEFVYKNFECVDDCSYSLDDCKEFVYKNTERVDSSCCTWWHKRLEPEDIPDGEKDYFDVDAFDVVNNEKNWLEDAFDGVDKVLESMFNSVEKACYREQGV